MKSFLAIVLVVALATLCLSQSPVDRVPATTGTSDAAQAPSVTTTTSDVRASTTAPATTGTSDVRAPATATSDVRAPATATSDVRAPATTGTSEVHTLAPVPTTCTSRVCHECLADTTCGFCIGGAVTGTSWGACRGADAIGAFCTHESGALVTSCDAAIPPSVAHHDGPVAVAVTDAIAKINSGAVTETQVNNDLNAAQPLVGFTVIVTVITQAQNNADGTGHFQTFVDVIGPTAPTTEQQHSICTSIRNVLSTHINLPASGIECALTPRATVKRQAVTSSYVADMTVSNMSNGASHVMVSAAALAAVAVATLV